MTGHKPEQIRTPMRWDASANAGFTTGTPWEPLSEDSPERNVETEAADAGSLLSTDRTLIGLRTAHPALAHGTWTPLTASDPAATASLRQAEGETVLVVANLGDAAVSGVGLSLAAGPLCGTRAAESLLGPAGVVGPTITATGGLDGYVPVASLGAHETLVVRLAP